MSQTCKAWREFFWPILWENVELGAARGTGSGPWYKRVSKVLIDKCEGLANTPLVAAQVRGIRISLSKPNIKDDLESLIKGLRACPNLKVLNFYFVQNTSITPLKNAFKGNSFPSIERVILPSSAHNALRSCPNVKAVICSGGKGGGMQILSSIQAACKKVEVLGGVVPDNDKEKAEFVKKVNKAIPNLRDIRFLNNGANTKEFLVLLKNFKNLQTIELTGIGLDFNEVVKLLSDFLRDIFGANQETLDVTGIREVPIYAKHGLTYTTVKCTKVVLKEE